MRLPIYQVDAFATRVFTGNPAAVCPLSEWLPDERMQAIALENNLSETAFFKAGRDTFDLRWFTPAAEVDLCGHATLAAAHIVFEKLRPSATEVHFDSRSGPLGVTRHGDTLELDFPRHALEPVDPPAELERGLGTGFVEVLTAGPHYLLVVFEDEARIRDLAPDFATLARLSRSGVIATAPGREVDFVSRFFAPALGVPEDPVTGSAHCALTPYWSRRLGKDVLAAHQISPRGGELRCTLRGERVGIAGRCVLYLEGEIRID